MYIVYLRVLILYSQFSVALKMKVKIFINEVKLNLIALKFFITPIFNGIETDPLYKYSYYTSNKYVLYCISLNALHCFFFSVCVWRHFQGEDLEPLSFKDLQSLEKQLDITLALTRQHQVMSLNEYSLMHFNI